MAEIRTSSPSRRRIWSLIARFLLPILIWYACYHLIVQSATNGTSRFFSMLSIIEARIEPANQAVRLSPADPEAHYTRALALVNGQRLEEAIAELRTTTQLRPSHYYEWLDLGVTLDRVGDQSSAITALKESVRLA